ncbi:hypothetical protein SprV_0301208600 [Sparganum proliferum]
MLVDVYRGKIPGICVYYRTDGQLLNRRRMHFQSPVSTDSVHELLFDVDCTLNPATEGTMQRSMYFFAAACNNFGIITNIEKTVVMHQPPPNSAYNAHHININGAQLQAVDSFTCLGSILFRSIKIDDKMARGSPSPAQPSAV